MAAETFDGESDSGEPAEAQLTRILREANRRIYELAVSDDSHRGMGTTVTAAKVTGDEVSLGHVGDSRAYRCATASWSSSRATTRWWPSSSAAARSRPRRPSTIRNARSSRARSAPSPTCRSTPTRSRDATATCS